MLFCFALLAIFAFTPVMNILSLVALNGTQWGIVLGLSFGVFLSSEVYKLIDNYIRKRKRKVVVENQAK